MNKLKLSLAILFASLYLTGCVTREVHHETQVVEVPSDYDTVVVPGDVIVVPAN